MDLIIFAILFSNKYTQASNDRNFSMQQANLPMIVDDDGYVFCNGFKGFYIELQKVELENNPRFLTKAIRVDYCDNVGAIDELEAFEEEIGKLNPRFRVPFYPSEKRQIRTTFIKYHTMTDEAKKYFSGELKSSEYLLLLKYEKVSVFHMKEKNLHGYTCRPTLSVIRRPQMAN